ncbi:MAG: antitoxin [Kangiella sp.]|nr:MAG: antitoxin [Kangiella sp.]
MQTKLTLRLEDELIKLAKIHAKEQGKSLSQIVSDYFTIFTKKTKKQSIAPITQSLIGILKDSNLDEKDYKKHLEEKYL